MTTKSLLSGSWLPVLGAMWLGAVVAFPAAAQDGPCPSFETVTVRNAHGMVYHGARETVLLFGGADHCQVLGDTWEWDGVEWTRVTEGGPSARTFPTMAYDELKKQVVLFGGTSVYLGSEDRPAEFFDDTWILSDGSWEKIAPLRSPPARAEASMAYDAARDRVVLFGGYHIQLDEVVWLGDTWEWDGTHWTPVAVDGPSPRGGASMVFDPRRKGVVLFGGDEASAETWLWNGKTWSRIQARAVPGRDHAVMVFDPVRGGELRFGGWDGNTTTGDTWLLSEETWDPLPGDGPPARSQAAFVYDGLSRNAILFGGSDGDLVFGDLWIWDGELWSLERDLEPMERLPNGH